MERVRLKASATAQEHRALVDKAFPRGALLNSSDTRRTCTGIRQLSKWMADTGATVAVGGYRQKKGEAGTVHAVWLESEISRCLVSWGHRRRDRERERERWMDIGGWT